MYSLRFFKNLQWEGSDADPTALAEVSGRLPRALGNLPRTWAHGGAGDGKHAIFLSQNLGFKIQEHDEG